LIIIANKNAKKHRKIAVFFGIFVLFLGTCRDIITTNKKYLRGAYYE